MQEEELQTSVLCHCYCFLLAYLALAGQMNLLAQLSDRILRVRSPAAERELSGRGSFDIICYALSWGEISPHGNNPVCKYYCVVLPPISFVVTSSFKEVERFYLESFSFH